MHYSPGIVLPFTTSFGFFAVATGLVRSEGRGG
jgi:hypothetical protein